ncbi:MAG: exodeoxyribonuclease VII large subunit [Chloroflexota bacterium]|nr:exodeoxyribonuclease VII large subunit [Chloroflexota bacterium]
MSPRPQGDPGPQARSPIQSVGDLTRLVKETLRGERRLHNLWVEGEVGQVSVSSAGHCYFVLKDERAQLRCMIFRDDRMVIPFAPQTGLRLVAHGRIDVFEPQGHYQLYVDSLQPAGFGDLALRFEALKARLAAEGLFDAGRKRPLPAWPSAVGVVTSLSGAVLHDIRRVLARRWPLVQVLVAACQVQGEAAPASIVSALRRLGRWRDPASGRPVDLAILARGGGSLEDLWAFNDENVVRAVAAYPRPVVVGVGHETDVTLAEFAADVRAPTPSVAAELAVPSRADQLLALRALEVALRRAFARSIGAWRGALEAERRALESFRPAAYLASERERTGLLLDRASRAVQAQLAGEAARLSRTRDRLPLLVRGRLVRARTDLQARQGALAALSPFATLERGYAIVRDQEGRIVRQAASRPVGSQVQVRLARGELDARVERVRESSGE